MRLEPITDHISLLQGNTEGSFPYSHSILILDEEVVLIDTGCGIENLRQLRKKYDVSYVINSHTHPDHYAGDWVFGDKPIYVPEEGFDTAGDVVALAERFVTRELARVFRKFVSEAMGFKDCRPTGSYSLQTAFDFGETTLEPVYTPGHAKDHYCFYERSERILFSFDYDLTSFPWYGHRESNLLEFKESVKKLKALSPKIVVSSHRGVVAGDIDAEFDKFYERMDRRDEKLLSLLEGERTVDELVECAPIYGGFPYAEPLLRYWEGQMIEKHLEQLVIDSRVRRAGDAYVTV